MRHTMRRTDATLLLLALVLAGSSAHAHHSTWTQTTFFASPSTTRVDAVEVAGHAGQDAAVLFVDLVQAKLFVADAPTVAADFAAVVTLPERPLSPTLHAAVDAQGRLHVFVVGDRALGGQRVTYATNASGAWQAEVALDHVAAAPFLGAGASAAGGEGKLLGTLLGVATLLEREGGAWTLRTLAPVTGVPDLASDAAGNEHLCLPGLEGVLYARSVAGAAPVARVVDPLVLGSGRCSVDGSDAARGLVLYDAPVAGGRGLKLANVTASGVAVETVPLGWAAADVVLGDAQPWADGTVSVAAHAAGQTPLVVSRVGASWQTENVTGLSSRAPLLGPAPEKVTIAMRWAGLQTWAWT